MLKYFPGSREMIGTIVIPSSLLLVLLILPLLDRILPGKLAHFLACGFVFTVLGGAGFLTVQAIWDDAHNPIFQESRKKADAARSGRCSWPARRWPASHRMGPPTSCDGIRSRKARSSSSGDAWAATSSAARGPRSRRPRTSTATAPAPGSAACSRIRSRPPTSARSPSATGWPSGRRVRNSRGRQLDDVADFVAAFAKIDEDTTPEEWLNRPEVASHPGKAPFEKECGTCHMVDGFTEGGLREAPNLFAWGSHRWTARMIRKPNAADRYGFLEKEQKMPAFDADQLSPNDLQMVLRYLQGDYIKPPPGEHVADSPSGQPTAPAKSP